MFDVVLALANAHKGGLKATHCGTCFYMRAVLDPNDELKYQECRRFPPQVYEIGAMGTPRHIFPRISALDVCGEWKEIPKDD